MKVLELPIDKIFVTKNVRLEKDGELGDLMLLVDLACD